MLPIVATLISSGLGLLGNAVMAKGQEFVEEKLGVKLDDMAQTQEGRIKLAQIQAEREAELHSYAIRQAEQELAGFKLEVEDRGSARARDAEFVKRGVANTRANWMFMLAVVVVCALVWIVWKEPGINEYVKGIVTLVLGRFLGYLDNIYNFEFGTTRSSRDKDATINKLSGSGQ